MREESKGNELQECNEDKKGQKKVDACGPTRVRHGRDVIILRVYFCTLTIITIGFSIGDDKIPLLLFSRQHLFQ